MSLTFSRLREANRARQADFIANGASADWSTAEWLMALIGEVGELANFMKKDLRDGTHHYLDIMKELADIQVYLDLLADSLEVNLELATIDKFNEVSERIGSRVRL